jgi:hypothetical protein
MNKYKSISEDSILNKFDNLGKDFDFIWLKNFLNCNHRYSLKEIAVKLEVNNGDGKPSQIW